MTDLLTIGTPAPQFTTLSSTGNSVCLTDYRGKYVVLYFYPKDDTPGCTKEACGFRDAHLEFEQNNVVILGVSKDSVASHQKFQNKYQLPFVLLSDEDLAICKAYHAWGQKSMYGRKYDGIFRVTYLIDPEGMIKQVFPKVDPVLHAKEILGAVKL
ncbi:thioredoxin-dependent thiol peroxidase [Candidatus Gracilibacteria bacterium]|nr:thioredoxin-dependent thiol peroxidase [Candidatus Gracilibacteria bacterium]